MLDCELFGLKPGPHHLVNVLFHAANAVLLFLILQTMTGAFWRSAAVAALFAWHPLQVDTVAWVAERKNVLSTLFWLLTLLAYVRYARKSEGRSQKPEAVQCFPASVLRPLASGYYWLALALFALGLMCKPVLVTFPFVLLLLDYWPLNRFQLSTFNSQLPTLARLILEKLPFLVLSAASSAITVIAHQRLGSIVEGGYSLPFGLRVENAVVSYVRYLGKTLWPDSLAICYPHPGAWPSEYVIGSLTILLLISGLAVWQIRRRPYLLVGWLWFLGVLVPAIGVIQAGVQAMADRFAYVPLVGLFIAIVWGISEYASQARLSKLVMPLAVAGVLLGCVIGTSLQLRYWKDGVTLFTHALDVTENNVAAHTVLGDALLVEGKTNEAIAHFSEAIRLNPLCADALNDMAVLFAQQGNRDEARPYLEAAIRIKPQFRATLNKLGFNFAAQGRFEEAISYYHDALDLEPNNAETCNNLAWLLAPNPDAKFRDGPEAVRLAEHACELTHYQTPIIVGTLAAAYAEAGRRDDAVAAGEKARALAVEAGQKALADKNTQLLELYRARQPYRETPKAHSEDAESGVRNIQSAH